MPAPQPIWVTPAGEIGTYTEEVPVVYNFSANPGTLGNTLEYTVLNGQFPPGSTPLTEFQLSTLGALTGTPAQVNGVIGYEFTIRLNEYSGPTLVSFIDRTFSLSVAGSTVPTFLTPAGPLYPGPVYLPDSTWNPYQILISNPDPDTTAIVRLINGSLPPGLEINSSGLIRGYASPPPTTTTYNFTLEVTSESGSTTSNYSITVVNQDSIPSVRYPVITNTRPPNFVPPEIDPYAPYYLNSSGNIGSLYHDNYFIFKIIGVDFYDDPLTYAVSSGSLPPGLNLNAATGWITGTVGTPPGDPLVQTYTFSVTVTSTVTTLTSAPASFTVAIVQSIDNVPVNISVNWISPSHLGVIDNGSISTLNVEASNPSGIILEYTLTSGTLPSNLQLLTTGDIVGRVNFETEGTLLPEGSTVSYQFTVSATNPVYPEITSSKTFTLDLFQKFSTPYENLYIKAYLNITDREKILDLIQDINIFPSDYLYRPDDPYFGVAKGLIYQHMFGVESSSVATYINSVYENHYWRNLILGPLTTAKARNSSGQIVYEVIYSPIIDNLINPDGVSVHKVIQWPRTIVNYGNFVYPNSLPNMREQISDMIPGQVTSSSILPLWMSSQQDNGSSLGFIPAWVIAYVKPGYSSQILNNINNIWGVELNSLSFIIDRFEIDKSYTFDYSGGSWTTLPSNGVDNDTEDKYIFFPQKNILS